MGGSFFVQKKFAPRLLLLSAPIVAIRLMEDTCDIWRAEICRRLNAHTPVFYPRLPSQENLSYSTLFQLPACPAVKTRASLELAA